MQSIENKEFAGAFLRTLVHVDCSVSIAFRRPGAMGAGRLRAGKEKVCQASGRRGFHRAAHART